MRQFEGFVRQKTSRPHTPSQREREREDKELRRRQREIERDRERDGEIKAYNV
jgi:hypothetical protein